jgi:hypothetical protein
MVKTMPEKERKQKKKPIQIGPDAAALYAVYRRNPAQCLKKREQPFARGRPS